MVKEIVENFAKSGVSQAALERILDLGQGDLSKEETPEMIALMRIVATYPWLLSVAEHHYDEKYANRVVLHVGVDALLDMQEQLAGSECKCEKEQPASEDAGKS
ncbi:MAG: hypothetical protein PHF86_04820 [Candidatus Nanoarchaeia archaeon]|jgi:hypothetical protein|nr:hypothetical protein [Candidatus Nanoarchaeia archaeon]